MLHNCVLKSPSWNPYAEPDGSRPPLTPHSFTIHLFIYLSCQSKYIDIGYVNLNYTLSKYNNDYDIIPLEI
jgi:hypothetical protein